VSALSSINTYSDEALNGAIRQLSFNGQWANRLHALLMEKKRRAKLYKLKP